MRWMMLGLVAAVALGAGCDAEQLERLGILRSTPTPKQTATPTQAPTATPDPTPEPTLAPATASITFVSNTVAQPSEVTIRKGGKVTFQHEGRYGDLPGATVFVEVSYLVDNKDYVNSIGLPHPMTFDATGDYQFSKEVFPPYERPVPFGIGVIHVR